MVDWSSTAEIINDANIFSHIIHIFYGIYSWELLINLPFDFSIWSGKRQFRWPMIVYFLCRYAIFIAVLGVILALDVTTYLNCQALYTFNQFFGEVSIGSASSLLMLRTIAVWRRNWWVTAPLLLLCAGQWGILMHAVTTVRASWNTEAEACVINQAGTIGLDLIYLYTMFFDFVVLVMTVIGLTRLPGRSTIWNIIFRDGAIYFLVAFGSNSLPAIFVLLNLNPSMNIMFSVPAATASAMVACRSFISLSTYQNSEPYVHDRPAQPSHNNSTLVGTKISGKNVRGTNTLQDGVHIHMDTFATQDIGPYTPAYNSDKIGHFPHQSHLSFDA